MAAIAAVVVGAALAIAASMLIGLLRSRLDESTTQAALLRARDVGGLVQSGAIPKQLAFIGEETTLIQVINSAGTVVASTENIDGEPRVETRQPAAGTPLIANARVAALDRTDLFRIVAIRVSGSGGSYDVYVGQDLEGNQDTVRAITSVLLTGLPMLVALVAATTWWAAGRTLRPVRRVTRTLAEITETDLHRRVPETQMRDEIGDLTSTINVTLGRLDVAVARQRRFVADASHELRGPLASLRADLEISVEHPDKTQWTSVVSDTLLDVERLQHLTDDLLMLARLDATHTPVHLPVDLASIVIEATIGATNTGIKIETIDADQPALIAGSHSQLDRLVRNLIDNAVAHADSRVTVSLNRSSRTIHVLVADDGPGIPEADRERVFEPFVRLDTARTRDSGGTGLGLAIVRDIVTNHGGTIVVSGTVGSGTTFEISFPRYRQHPARNDVLPRRPLSVEATDPSMGRGPRVRARISVHRSMRAVDGSRPTD